METDNKENIKEEEKEQEKEGENNEENKEENNIVQIQNNQKADNQDNFSDQEIEDDFYKIQIENFKNKTSSYFHKNIRIIDEKGREIRSARLDNLNHKKYKDEKNEANHKKQSSKHHSKKL